MVLTLRLLQEVQGTSVDAAELELLAAAAHPDPRRLLGAKVVDGLLYVRSWVSGAEAVSVRFPAACGLAVADATGGTLDSAPLTCCRGLPQECRWLFEAAFEVAGTGDMSGIVGGLVYDLEVQYGGGGTATLTDPYCLGDLLPTDGLKAWSAGEPSTALPPPALFGAHHLELREKRPGLWGTRFAVWAPDAVTVSVVGDFNFWDGRAHLMCPRAEFGVWEVFVPEWDLRGKKYGYQVLPADGGKKVVKADPFGTEFVHPSDGGHDAKVPEQSDFDRAAWNGTFPWSDGAWLEHRRQAWSESSWAKQPLSIYEVHLSSWMTGVDGSLPNYRDLAEPLAKHVLELGFVAVEFLPLSQYPAEKSWGYQCASGLYAVDSRLGTPDDFRFLVDTLHRHSIAVFVDFVAAHFARDPWGLVNFSGRPQFEYDGHLGELPGWGTARFNYAKPQVRSYLLGAVDHWISHFHVDGLRFDAVAAMVYGSFGREEDGDAILAGRGVVNPDGVTLLRDLCARVRRLHPGVLLAAEESTNFKWVTQRPSDAASERERVQVQDLGFHLKWNMGFTFDTLGYLCKDFASRPSMEIFGCKQLAWYLAYAFNERWVLPLSHDNAQPRGLLDQLGDPCTSGAHLRFAQLRLLLAYTVGMPGRPLLFMGTEVGEPEWSHDRFIDWDKVDSDVARHQLREWTKTLMQLYRRCPALHLKDDESSGFEWLDKDRAGRCTYSWRRRAETPADDVIFVINASAAPVLGYRVSCGSREGGWRLLSRTSADDSGGGFTGPRRFAEAACEFTLDLSPLAVEIWTCGPDPLAVPLAASAWRFEIRHPRAAAGDQVRVVGGCPMLASWQPAAAPALSEAQGGLWTGEVDFIDTVGEVEFKFVCLKADGAVEWEAFDGNRRLQLGSAGQVARIVVADFGKL